MSSGPADANAETDLANDIDIAFLDVYEAIKAGRTGHRGYAISVDFILRSCNSLMRSLGFELTYRGDRDR